MIQTMATSLAWVPVVEPMPIEGFWLWWMVPMVVLICLTYRTMRAQRMADVARETLVMSLQVLAFMVGVAIVLFIVTDRL